jgi:Flp pilus assembly pilin Flp
MVEYGLILALVGAFSVAVLNSMGVNLSQGFNSLAQTMGTALGGGNSASGINGLVLPNSKGIQLNPPGQAP